MIKRSLSTLLLCMVIGACSPTRHVNGCYPITDLPENKIDGKVIVTVSDIAAATLDTVTSPEIAVIEVKLKPDKILIWADATEQRIGKRIGFVYNDSVITAPKINCRITGGTFTINSENKSLILDIYSSIINQ